MGQWDNSSFMELSIGKSLNGLFHHCGFLYPHQISGGDSHGFQPSNFFSVKTRSSAHPQRVGHVGGTIGSRNIHAAVDFSGSDLEIIELEIFVGGIVSINPWFFVVKP